MTTRIPSAIAAAALVLLNGCADPYGDGDRRTTPAPPPGEIAAPPVPHQAEQLARDAALPTPAAVARRAAELTSNWTSATAASHYAHLARTSTGAARRAFEQAAASLPTDPQLTVPGARGTGRLEKVAERGGGRYRRRLLVVTRETTRADGLDQTRWRVTLATAERRPGGWILAKWEPQP